MGRNLFGAFLDKSFKCLQTILSELVVVLPAVSLNQRHRLLYVLSKPVSGLTAVRKYLKSQDIFIRNCCYQMAATHCM